MTRLAIRKSGGASIVSIPKSVLKLVGLGVGSEVELSLENHRIVLTPIEKEVTLEDLLAGSPKEKLTLDTADREWLNITPKGKEI
ncbi:MAG: transcriptional regulator [Coxiella sp. RIFCSPHIGHO2_12_FULL_44_14]|nr:MAG: transcriptional regulator [Coxiella sp. RIFCSPHIGHO2_12_FULL_44_14]